MIEMPFGRPTKTTIDLDALSFNLRSVRSFIGDDIKIMAVVKADGYGHGAVECSRRLSTEGVDWFGVALPEEGIELRKAGIAEPILCLGSFWDGQNSSIIENDLTPVIYQLEQARSLNQAAVARGKIVNIHVKVDTGMGRIGVRFSEIEDFATAIVKFENLRIDGLMTHFAVADDLKQIDFTQQQIAKFERSVEIFRNRACPLTFTDLANSPGAIAHPESRSRMVRLGGVLYGLGGDVLPGGIDIPKLKPVLSLSTKVAHIKTVPAGETIGYGRTFKTARESLVASIPIGYADGLPRSLSNVGQVIIKGVMCPIVGRVSMDWTLIDITDATDVKLNDNVVIIGSQDSKRILSEDIARITDTISYEITCGIGRRVRREFVRE